MLKAAFLSSVLFAFAALGQPAAEPEGGPERAEQAVADGAVPSGAEAQEAEAVTEPESAVMASEPARKRGGRHDRAAD